jgi:rhodanese-related sulfurtransferase
MNTVTAVKLAEWLKSDQPPKLLDVRQDHEYELARLENARLVPLPELPMRTGELADWKDQDIVVYCHHGVRSQMAIGVLRLAGFHKLHNLTGGINAWSLEVDAKVARY